ncbi:hypothetical protein NDU88_003540 [Pleurodeles waltl]|uniref:Uncharacterized protein n=1 Tax=Pleurodeles waltl TaxID=8319 RepID=A0AAV7PCY6_PLEWA|nr:hypothetical protein NDU88_003540 [Pleurodeles waltl]
MRRDEKRENGCRPVPRSLTHYPIPGPSTSSVSPDPLHPRRALRRSCRQASPLGLERRRLRVRHLCRGQKSLSAQPSTAPPGALPLLGRDHRFWFSLSPPDTRGARVSLVGSGQHPNRIIAPQNGDGDRSSGLRL